MALNGSARVDDQARGVPGRFRFRQERVNGLPGYGPVRVKELALDCTKAPFPLLGHQINARVRSVAVRPLVPQPHALEAVPQDARLPGQGGLHQALEGAPHAKQVGGTVAENR